MPLISVIVPVFRNQGSLPELIGQLQQLAETRTGQDEFEWIFVDDGSDDGSLEVIRTARKTDPRVSFISFSRNFGQVAAIEAGLLAAKGDAAIIMAADLQDPIDMLPKMLDAHQAGTEIVICFRRNRKDGFWPKAFSRLFYRLIRIDFPQMPAGGFDFLLLDRKAIDALNQVRNKNRFLQGDILSLGFTTQFLPYDRLARKHGKSQWISKKKRKYFIDGILNSSYWPIRIMSGIGIFTFLSGIGYAGLITWLRIANKTPFEGWAPIMILILLIGGLVLLTLGLIGEYLWRIYDEVKEKPSFIIREQEFNPPKP